MKKVSGSIENTRKPVIDEFFYRYWIDKCPFPCCPLFFKDSENEYNKQRMFTTSQYLHNSCYEEEM
jgi:hypothetical protein